MNAVDKAATTSIKFLEQNKDKSMAEIASMVGVNLQAGWANFDAEKALAKQLGPEGFAAKAVRTAAVPVTEVFGDVGRATIAAARGVVHNPHRVVLFTGVNFREFQFSYRLSPRNASESRTIRFIIFMLKHAMYPSYSAGLFGSQIGTKRGALVYPDIFKIRFKNDAFLFQMKPCVLKSLDVQYHPQGYPGYIRDTAEGIEAAPVEVQISMQFQELDMIDKQWIRNEMDDAEGDSNHNWDANNMGPD